MVLVKDILNTLDKLSKGRCIKYINDYVYENNQYVVTKSSGIPGKAITEMSGLVCGDLNMEAKKVAVIMTLTESVIELAKETGVNVIIAHHPVAEAGNSRGVPLKSYLNLYNIAVFELHEAFHGLHDGIPLINGYKIKKSFINQVESF